MTTKDVEKFIDVSNIIGAEAAFVQGGGGNTSLKVDSQRMWIKASGSLLKDMRLNQGFSVVDYNAICEYLENSDCEEDLFTKKIKSLVLETDNRPSIETGFHALLGECVIHTHSVYSNVLTCSKEGEGLVKQLFPNAFWVDYSAPGRDLTLKIKNAVNNTDKKSEKVIFLQNHGLIVSSSSPAKAKALHSIINSRIQGFLKLDSFSMDYSRVDYDLKFMSENVLFPDQIVYTMADEEVLKSDAARETLASYEYILGQIKDQGFQPSYLSEHDVHAVMTMESEKFRLKVLKNENHSSPS